MLVGLVNKGKVDSKYVETPTESKIRAKLPPTKVRFSHLDELTNNMSPINSPRSIMVVNESEKKVATIHRKKTPNFMLNKEKQLNRFLSNAKLANQMSHIIDMEDQVLYIGIIGRANFRHFDQFWGIEENGVCL